MIEIKPFKGITYNNRKINLKDVTAPPYDVISPEELENFYRKSEYNVVRLVLGKNEPGDNGLNNKYTRSANYLKNWLNQNVLLPSDKPAIYIYKQKYKAKGRDVSRVGFIALLKLEDFESGKVLPHEKTFPKAKVDRLNLLRACETNFSQVFSLYLDPEGKIDNILKKFPDDKSTIKIIDEDRANHTLHQVFDEKIIKKISQLMKDKTIFIADGHHRYETALNYRNEMRKKINNYSGIEGFNYVMMMFVNMNDEGLSVLPVHRVIKDISLPDENEILEKAANFFKIESFKFNEGNKEKIKNIFSQRLSAEFNKTHAFGIYPGTNKYHLLILKDENIMDKLIPSEHSQDWKKLDITILHSLLIEKIIGIKDKNLIKHKSIKFTPDENEALELVDKGEYKIALLVNPTKVEEVRAVASNREKMPQKSTYFYPKLLTGLVINKHGK
ncbi:DUF1015 domain-containing protein [Candidatus Oleimmundimicrobium sp.]|uniref:DUF1015 domain-containing protein n=1 Tax=Candidatus Oleimmundimicrobium sp. TaxID=3060597 RepID=UPI002717A2D6|nr:DUF1015 domain-containing protein [Candidatus Oleimmundimicrobium sp.]MDO8885686.1 DUF1015 domain-containing protein [Candidatus Oleimmundimicrobium sp.]